MTRIYNHCEGINKMRELFDSRESNDAQRDKQMLQFAAELNIVASLESLRCFADMMGSYDNASD